MSDVSTTYVSILDKEYQIACPEDEKATLTRAAQELDKRMRSVRASGAVAGSERIAVITALNLCAELLKAQTGSNETATDALERIAKKLDGALSAF